MQMNTKLPEGLTNISKMMGMQKEEVRAWPYYNQLTNLFKDYNLGAITKTRLIDKLMDISAKCIEDDICYFSLGIEQAVNCIKFCY